MKLHFFPTWQSGCGWKEISSGQINFKCKSQGDWPSRVLGGHNEEIVNGHESLAPSLVTGWCPAILLRENRGFKLLPSLRLWLMRIVLIGNPEANSITLNLPAPPSWHLMQCQSSRNEKSFPNKKANSPDPQNTGHGCGKVIGPDSKGLLVLSRPWST